MKFKYRVKGKVNSQFVVRGMLFRVDTNIDFCVSENELTFVKQHCSIESITNIQSKLVVEPPKPMLEENTIESENKSKEVENEVPTKQSTRTNKGKRKTNLQLA